MTKWVVNSTLSFPGRCEHRNRSEDGCSSSEVAGDDLHGRRGDREGWRQGSALCRRCEG